MLNRTLQAIACLAWSVFPAVSAFADQPVRVIEITCAPELSIFTASTKTFYNISTDSNAALKRHGLFLANKFDYTCKLPEASYRIYGSTPDAQPKGICGGSPRTMLNVKRNENYLLKEIYFSPSCINEASPYITSIIIEESPKDFSHRVATVRLFDDEKRIDMSGSIFSVTRTKKTILNQKRLDCFAKDTHTSLERCLSEIK